MKIQKYLMLAPLAISLGAVPAVGADLGGDCCADLEERIAELEATTARKGNRKVSLTISGQINETLYWWDDGVESNVYQGSNTFNSSRFRFKGNAKINSEWSAGYHLEIDFEGAIAARQTQDNDDVSRAPRLRHAVWYLKSNRLGEVRVGQDSFSTDNITYITTSGLGAASSANLNVSPGAGLGYRNSDGSISTVSGASLWQLTDTDRGNVVRYVSPVLAGFNLQAAWGEDDIWDVALRYAGELGQFRVAGGIGFLQNVENGAGPGRQVNYGAQSSDFDDLRGMISIMHTPTGLFIDFSGINREFDNPGLGDFQYWYIRPGIAQKFNSLGKTVLFGEYSEATGALEGTTADTEFLGASGLVADSEQTSWGLGVSQFIDAAAMELYLGYRNTEADLTDTNGGRSAYDDIDVVYSGARIKF